MFEEIKLYLKDKFPIADMVFHKDFYLNKEERNGEYISLCVGGRLAPIIRFFNKEGVEVDKLYFYNEGIKIEQIISDINEEIRKPNIVEAFNIIKEILDNYTQEEIFTICFTDFSNTDSLIDEIGYKLRDAQKLINDLNNIILYNNLGGNNKINELKYKISRLKIKDFN